MTRVPRDLFHCILGGTFNHGAMAMAESCCERVLYSVHNTNEKNATIQKTTINAENAIDAENAINAVNAIHAFHAISDAFHAIHAFHAINEIRLNERL